MTVSRKSLAIAVLAMLSAVHAVPALALDHPAIKRPTIQMDVRVYSVDPKPNADDAARKLAELDKSLRNDGDFAKPDKAEQVLATIGKVEVVTTIQDQVKSGRNMPVSVGSTAVYVSGIKSYKDKLGKKHFHATTDDIKTGFAFNARPTVGPHAISVDYKLATSDVLSTIKVDSPAGPYERPVVQRTSLSGRADVAEGRSALLSGFSTDKSGKLLVAIMTPTVIR